MISFKGYNVCVLDFFTDEKNGRLSATKFWLHVANGIMSYAVLQQVMKAEGLSWEMMVAYGAVVGGSHVGTLFMKWKYGSSFAIDRRAERRRDNSDRGE